jgi:zinc transport system substrate-binding protein
MRIVLMLKGVGRGGRAAFPAVAALLTALTACGTDGAAAGDRAAAGGTLSVVASFYPLQYAAERVGAGAVRVTNLTRPGAEPHDLELSPRDVAAVADADLVVYLAGFQPAVDDAAGAQAAGRSLDVSAVARLDLRGTEEDAAGGAAHDGVDPHFWLDPTRLADVADAVAARLGVVDPPRAATFTANAVALRADLTTLDGQFRTGLANCTSRDLVTSHQAFGYLAQRYRLTQVGITGLTPDAEPEAATLAKVTDFVRAHDVATIYYETLVSPAVARTVASETGARTAVLDPIEGIADTSAAPDYLGVMQANLAALRAGQPCP